MVATHKAQSNPPAERHTHKYLTNTFLCVRPTQTRVQSAEVTQL